MGYTPERQECLEEIYRITDTAVFILRSEDYYNVYSPQSPSLEFIPFGESPEGGADRGGAFWCGEKFRIDDPEYARKLSDDFLERTTHKTRLIEGALDLLDYLKPRYRMHILSNGLEVQYKKIENSGLKPYFDKIILSEDAGVNKPHPEITYALKNTNSRRDQTVMIGDSWDADIQGATEPYCADMV